MKLDNISECLLTGDYDWLCRLKKAWWMPVPLKYLCGRIASAIGDVAGQLEKASQKLTDQKLYYDDLNTVKEILAKENKGLLEVSNKLKDENAKLRKELADIRETILALAKAVQPCS